MQASLENVLLARHQEENCGSSDLAVQQGQMHWLAWFTLHVQKKELTSAQDSIHQAL